nr:ABC transporter B family member 19-like [Tanacetum cinerariifolium]
MLLDEATSALDAESERSVVTAMESINRNEMTTQVMVAHRLSTVVHLDTIVVMDKGKVVEMGTHSALVAESGGVYSRFHRIQSMK